MMSVLTPHPIEPRSTTSMVWGAREPVHPGKSSGGGAVEVPHHAGAVDRGPHFELAQDPAHRPETDVGDKAAEIRSGSLTARVSRGAPWRLEFLHEGRVLTTNGARALGFVDTAAGQHHMV